jgi:hypothetical protein
MPGSTPAGGQMMPFERASRSPRSALPVVSPGMAGKAPRRHSGTWSGARGAGTWDCANAIVLARNTLLAAETTLNMRMASTRTLLLLALRDPQLADRAHEILFRGAPQLSTDRRARGITRLSIIFRGKLAVSACSCLVAVGVGEGVIHRRKLHETGLPSRLPRISHHKCTADDV